MFRRSVMLIALCGALAACGATPTKAAPNLSSVCPTNKSQLGCDTPRPVSLTPHVSLPSGLLFPDVSIWQGPVNWPLVAQWQRQHHWQPFAIFKAGEYTLDSQALRNASQTRANGVTTFAYWFVRNTGCSHEAGLIVWAAGYLGVKRWILDDEVPEAKGYAACLAPALRAHGLTVAEYTSPGSNPNTSNPGLDEWVASYGPSSPPCVWTCNVAVAGKQSIYAWQFTDGRYGSVVNIPGIGADDVSVSYGIERLGITPPPTPPKPKPLPSGTANATVHFAFSNGRWSVQGTTGKVTFGQKDQWASAELQMCVGGSCKGQWRVASLPWNSKPLGG